MDCDDCVYTDIADWHVQDGDTQKLKPVYWCERYDKLCDDVTDCSYKAESEPQKSEDNNEQTM